jgi:thymidylate synthase (FAD)
MEIKLVSITQPLINTPDGRQLTPEELIVYCARVSNPNNQLNTETGANLLKYCINHQHWSIFEQVSFSVEIKTSRAIAAQILRHKSFSFQEFSQRYSEVTKLQPVELRAQAEKNRQSSVEVISSKPLQDKVNEHLQASLDLYEELVVAHVAKECARMVLPLTTETTLYMHGTVRSWIHYINLRDKPDTQKEHRDVAEGAKALFIPHFPDCSKALGYV